MGVQGAGKAGALMLASSGYRLVLLGLGGGLVGMFDSQLPFKEAKPFEATLWTRPLLILGMGVVAYWQFSRMRWAAVIEHGTAACVARQPCNMHAPEYDAGSAH